MADEKQMKQARVVFDALCEMLDDQNWRYKRNDEELKITSGASGDDLPISFLMAVDPNNATVSIYSHLPFNFPEDKRVEASIIVSMVNYIIANGSFDYDLRTGSILFRVVTSFKGSLLSKLTMQYLLAITCSTVDAYNDKFKAFADGEMDIDAFIDFLNNK